MYKYTHICIYRCICADIYVSVYVYIQIHAEYIFYSIIYNNILLFLENILLFINSHYLELFTLTVRIFKILWD